MIIPAYKPLGLSSHQLAKQIGDKHGEKATHTGTLDPMAEGVLVVLTGEDRFKKGEYSDWQKTYRFQILFGISTDSHDLLGITKNIDNKKINLDNLKKIIPDFVGKQIQAVPSFSAQRVGGRSGFDLAKENKKFDLQKNNIEIFSLKIIDVLKDISNKELLKYINRTISLVEGDFRQQEILNNWKNILEKECSLQLITLETVTSKRTYIRSLVNNIGQKLQTPATTFSIIRTQNGPFSIKDCS
jgi:tRNA pseudouridine55 synthase